MSERTLGYYQATSSDMSQVDYKMFLSIFLSHILGTLLGHVLKNFMNMPAEKYLEV